MRNLGVELAQLLIDISFALAIASIKSVPPRFTDFCKSCSQRFETKPTSSSISSFLCAPFGRFAGSDDSSALPALFTLHPAADCNSLSLNFSKMAPNSRKRKASELDAAPDLNGHPVAGKGQTTSKNSENVSDTAPAPEHGYTVKVRPDLLEGVGTSMMLWNEINWECDYVVHPSQWENIKTYRNFIRRWSLHVPQNSSPLTVFMYSSEFERRSFQVRRDGLHRQKYRDSSSSTCAFEVG